MFVPLFGMLIPELLQERRTTYAVTDRAALVMVAGKSREVARHSIDAGTRVDLKLGRRPEVLFRTDSSAESLTRQGFANIADPMAAYMALVRARDAAMRAAATPHADPTDHT